MGERGGGGGAEAAGWCCKRRDSVFVAGGENAIESPAVTDGDGGKPTKKKAGLDLVLQRGSK